MITFSLLSVTASLALVVVPTGSLLETDLRATDLFLLAGCLSFFLSSSAESPPVGFLVLFSALDGALLMTEVCALAGSATTGMRH